MTEGYVSVANSWIMWASCSLGVIWVCIQAVVFLRRSIKDGKKIGLTSDQIRRGSKSAMIASVGPNIVMLSSMLSLMVITGGPVAWLRSNIIGGGAFEIMGATFAANSMGIQPGTAEMTVDYLATATLVMTVGCLGWIIFTILFADKMDRVNNFMAGGNNALIPVISAGCIMGCYSNLVVEQVFPFGPEAVAGFAGAISMPVFIILSKKLDKPWLNDWALTFAMLIGVMASIPFL